ncbi:MAG TPA: hypothetical protein VD996_02535 [Chitinophagaceae bacterium]|nr:hypothetical protein [Chitinophagaceae bacterium]
MDSNKHLTAEQKKDIQGEKLYRWVKASERLPEAHASEVHWRYSHNKKPVLDNCRWVIDRLVVEKANTYTRVLAEYLEYLEEVQPNSEDVEQLKSQIETLVRHRQFAEDWLKKSINRAKHYKEGIKFLRDSYLDENDDSTAWKYATQLLEEDINDAVSDTTEPDSSADAGNQSPSNEEGKDWKERFRKWWDLKLKHPNDQQIIDYIEQHIIPSRTKR